MKATLIKKDGVLVPAFESDKEALKKIKEGTPVEVTLKRDRNYLFHKKFFAMLAAAFYHMPEDYAIKVGDQVTKVESVEQLRWHVTMQTGHYEQMVTLGGKMVYTAKSIAFDKMSQDEFEELYKAALDVLLKWFLPKGIDTNEFERQMINFM